MFHWIGFICIVLASSSVGFGYARAIQCQAAQLKELLNALCYMKNEILYRMTPLPELFDALANLQKSAVGLFFSLCSDSMKRERTLPISGIFKNAAEKCRGLCISPETRQALLGLGMALGRFDVDGQCRAIELAEKRLQQELNALEQNQRARCRGYEAIGICTGLAVAIVLI